MKKRILIISIVSILIITGVVIIISSKSKMSKVQSLYFEFASIHDNITAIIDKNNSCININTKDNRERLERAKQIIKETKETLYTDKSNGEASFLIEIMNNKIKDLTLLLELDGKSDISPRERMKIQVYKNGIYLLN